MCDSRFICLCTRRQCVYVKGIQQSSAPAFHYGSRVAYTARKKGNTYMHRKQSRYIYVACKVHNNVARSLTDAIAWRARDREFMRILRVRLGARVDAVFYTEYTWLRGLSRKFICAMVRWSYATLYAVYEHIVKRKSGAR